MVYNIQKKLQILNQSRSVHLHWVKGHSGIIGNEIADKTANQGHYINNSSLFPLTHSERISILKTKFENYWEDHWHNAVNMQNKGTFLLNIRDGNIKKNSIIFNSLTRREQVLLQRLRIGHAGVNSYLARFKIVQDEACPNCGLTTGTLEHYFLHCPTFHLERYTLEKGILDLGFNQLDLKLLLIGIENTHNLNIVKLLMTYIKDTQMHNTL